jgi:hypothetical protein
VLAVRACRKPNASQSKRRLSVSWLLPLASLGAGCNQLLDISVTELACQRCDAGAPEGPPLVAPSAAGTPAPIASGATAESGAAGASALTPGAAGAAPSPELPATGAGVMGATALPVAPDAGAPPPEVPPPPPAPPPGPALDAAGFAVPLPNDLLDAPVTGEIIYSVEAQWEVDGVFRPTFEVHTPTGSYWIVKSLGTMVSMQDAYAGQLQWIDFSSGFRPLRGVPAFATPPADVTTVLDPESQTPTHLRLTASTGDGAWQWVWDIYITHVTLTLNRAPAPAAFAYRGVPAGTLGAEDQLILADGTTQGARNSFQGDLPGPVEWAYIADTAAQRALFFVQHTDDALPEAYQVRDNDSAHWVFGGGQVALPIRYSLGLINSVDHATVSQRVAFIAGAIR